MTTQIIVSRNHGHPWTGEKDWDLMEILADSPEELTVSVEAAGRKFWAAWIVGTCPDGTPGAVMYKPAGATSAWVDDPNRRVKREE